jgi:hypothetical protein
MVSVREETGIRKEIAKVIGKWSLSKDDDMDIATKNINDRLREFFSEYLPGNPNTLKVIIRRNLIEANNLFTLVCIGGYDFCDKEAIPNELFPEYGIWTSLNSYYQFYESGSFVRAKTIQEKRDEKLDDLL